MNQRRSAACVVHLFTSLHSGRHETKAFWRKALKSSVLAPRGTQLLVIQRFLRLFYLWGVGDYLWGGEAEKREGMKSPLNMNLLRRGTSTFFLIM